MDMVERVYYTLLGQMADGAVCGVENAFVDGCPCMQRYGNMLDAYERLRKRLGVNEEDEDVEIIINALLDNQQELCYLMYRYGAEFGKHENW